MPRFSVANPSTHRRAGATAPARLLAAFAAFAAVAAAAPVAGAQTLTFNGLTAVDDSGERLVANCYVESGFRVTLMGMGCTGGDAAIAFGTWTPDNPEYYTGSPALHNNFDGTIEIAAVNGMAFSFRSIDLAPFLGSLGEETSVTFEGMLAGGGMMTPRTVVIPGGRSFGPGSATVRNYTFGGFDDITALRLRYVSPDVPGSRAFQFDNVALGPAQVIPEPATVALFGLGAAGLGLVARRRRAS
jgi:hypothetical protein